MSNRTSGGFASAADPVSTIGGTASAPLAMIAPTRALLRVLLPPVRTWSPLAVHFLYCSQGGGVRRRV
ncbi:hypothetical protein GCM10009727_52780 [Actinomadura napierensis]|uniref:Uncharacterized protein n=1 Tax=Actinomadura napierensis TaxID=267854 RepID=A0ABN2ZXG4_9ACTN